MVIDIFLIILYLIFRRYKLNYWKDLYKNENNRRMEINKIKEEIELDSGGGFVPKQFKSSRSSNIQNKKEKSTVHEKNESIHDKAMFSNEIIKNNQLPKNKPDDTSLPVKESVPKHLFMHENVSLLSLLLKLKNLSNND